MNSFSNTDVVKITGLTTRQIIYLTEKGIVDSDLEKAAGRGTKRRYSRKNVFQFLIAKSLRKIGLEWPALKAVVIVVSAFYDELLSEYPDMKSMDIPGFIHVAEGRYGYLSTSSGKTTMVFEVTTDGKVTPSDLTVAEVQQRTDAEVVINLGRRLSILTKGI